jgi:hypothetical protein
MDLDQVAAADLVLVLHRRALHHDEDARTAPPADVVAHV